MRHCQNSWGNEVQLNLEAENANQLLRKLAAIDVTVPLRTEGRTSVHCEKFMAAHLLATLGSNARLCFPLRLVHRDGPDFELAMNSKICGIECVEAIPQDWAHIDAIRNKQRYDSIILIPKLRAHQGSISKEIKDDIAAGRGPTGPPWQGDEPEREWANWIALFVNKKLQKLRDGVYSSYSDNWLLVQDETRVPVWDRETLEQACKCFVALVGRELCEPVFSRIYVANGQFLARLFPGPVEIQDVISLWRSND